MKPKHTFKLLSKTTFIYLIFTFIAFFISALFLTKTSATFISKELEHRFKYSEFKVKKYIEKGHDIKKLKTRGIITELKDPPGLPVSSQYSDTLMYNIDMGEIHHYRKKTTIINVGDKYYKFVSIKWTEDFYRLRKSIFEALVPAFILLALCIVLFNYFLSGYFFKPFNKILNQMKTYKVGDQSTVSQIDTSTYEFIQMQQLYHGMVERIENDYRNLKEYTEHMAHEIQTPLSIIRNKTENLVADHRIMQHQADAVKLIYNETNHLSNLGNGLNLLTKIENGEFNNAVQIKTKPVIEKHVEAIQELAGLKSLSIETNLIDDHLLYIDPFLLDIVLKNLLRNAVHYGTKDGPIGIQSKEKHLSISNYGPPLGVPGEKIFERFYRRQQSKGSSGLGLGLALVKKICDLNNLKISYEYREKQHIFRLEKHYFNENE